MSVPPRLALISSILDKASFFADSEYGMVAVRAFAPSLYGLSSIFSNRVPKPMIEKVLPTGRLRIKSVSAFLALSMRP